MSSFYLDGDVLTRMSMTNTILANSERGAPRVSTVMFPGQSHISSGMRVLLEDARKKRGRRAADDSLERVLRDAHGRFQVERLLRRQVLEQDLQDGRFATPAGSALCSNIAPDERFREKNLLVPKRRTFDRCSGTCCRDFASLRSDSCCC